MYVCTRALSCTQEALQNNLFHHSVRHSPVALFGLDAAETANRFSLVKLPFAKRLTRFGEQDLLI